MVFSFKCLFLLFFHQKNSHFLRNMMSNFAFIYFRKTIWYEIVILWVVVSVFQRFFQKPFNLDSRNTCKTNANPKTNILMSENIGQRTLNFFCSILRLNIITIFDLIKFQIGSNMKFTINSKKELNH